jgi:hypothetical protein
VAQPAAVRLATEVHALQLLSPVPSWYSSAAQLLHWEEASRLNVPEGQVPHVLMSVAASAAEAVPAEHWVHWEAAVMALAPLDEDQVPEGQALQLLLP